MIGHCVACGINSLLKKPTPPTPLGQLTWNLVGSIGVTCRSKIVKIGLIRSPRWPQWQHLENVFFASSPELKGQLTWNLVGNIGVTCGSKIAKIVPIGNQDRCRGGHLENLFFTTSEPKCQLTWNLVGSIRVTCRSKVAKTVQIWNPSWPPWRPSLQSIFLIFAWTKRPIDLKLDRKHRGDLYIKIAKIVPIRNPRWLP